MQIKLNHVSSQLKLNKLRLIKRKKQTFQPISQRISYKNIKNLQFFNQSPRNHIIQLSVQQLKKKLLTQKKQQIQAKIRNKRYFTEQQEKQCYKKEIENQIKDKISAQNRFFKQVYKRKNLSSLFCQNKKQQPNIHQSLNKLQPLKNIDRNLQTTNFLQSQYSENFLSSRNVFNTSIIPSQLQIQNERQLPQKQRKPNKIKKSLLNFNKVYILSSQQSPFKQVIQLSIKQLQNKQMLQKAEYQLQKRKHKNGSTLKDNLNRISNSQLKELSSSLKHMSTDVLKKFKNNDRLQQIKQVRKWANQNSEQLRSYDIFKHRNSNNQKNCQTNIQQEGNNSQIQNQGHNQIIQNQLFNNKSLIINKSLLSSRSKISSKPFIHKVRSAEFDFDANPGQLSNTNLNTGSNLHKQFQSPNYQKKLFKKSLSWIKSPNYHQNNKSLNDLSIRKSLTGLYRTQKINIERLNQKFTTMKNKESVIIKQKQFTATQMNYDQSQIRKVKKIQINPDENYFSSLTRQELVGTLDKSRYQIKKLMCLHIQKRKKQWKKIKSKLLLSEDFYKSRQNLLINNHDKILFEDKVEDHQENSQENNIFQDVNLRMSNRLNNSIKLNINKAKQIKSSPNLFKNSNIIQQQHLQNHVTIQKNIQRHQIKPPPAYMLNIQTKYLKKQLKQFNFQGKKDKE